MIPFPDKKYQIIYADPPWPVKKIRRKVRPNQIVMDYPTMSLDDISDLPVFNISAENSVCFLWSVQKFLPDAFLILRNWGFRYQRVISWDKGNGMSLFGFHHRTEFCLFGYRGKIEMYPQRKTIPTLWVEKSPRHSQKPDGFRRAIEVFGESRIELFARQCAEGWDVWGNEV
jgi:N6-adenosine-specific RNA methylase IME4